MPRTVRSMQTQTEEMMPDDKTMTLDRFFSDIKHAEEQKQFVVLSPEQARELLVHVLADQAAVSAYLKGE